MSNALKPCPTCGKDVAPSAPTCPHCGAVLIKKSTIGQKIGTFIGWVVGVLIVLIIIGGIFGDDKTSSSNEATPAGGDGAPSTQEVKSQGPKLLALNTPSTSGNYEFDVLGVSTARAVGTEYFSSQASEGGVYVIIKWSMKNISKKPLGLWDRPTTALLDPNGVEYSEDLDAGSNYSTQVDDSQEKILSDLNPGIKTKQYAVFEISREAWSAPGWTFKVSDGEDVFYGLK